jgi:acetylornithine deacetylase/succinyl-diaminopimelate desuccinylase-like protein
MTAFSSLLVGLAFAAAPPADLSQAPGTVLTDGVDWTATGQETATLLSAYLQIDTRNPPGDETTGAEFLAQWLAVEGITSEILEYAPGRGSLVARVDAAPGAATEAPLCLLSHIDVAEAEADRWTPDRGPMSGFIDKEGVIWGRGALDMKGMGAMEAMVLALVARNGVPLKRDLILLAVADEEVSNLGIRHLVDNYGDEIGCSHVINEGGLGITDMFFEGQTVYPISVGEKGLMWARLIATGEPSHGSVPMPGLAPERMLDAVGKLGRREEKPRYDESLLALLDAVGAHHGGASGWVLRHPAMVRSLLKGKLMGNPLTRAAVTDTVNITGYGGAGEPNVVPSEVWANVDARLQPGTTPAELRAELLALIDDPQVRLDVIMEQEATISPWRDDPLYAALAARAVEGRPHAVAGPMISVGYTDSIVLRPLGVHAYGFVPVAVDAELLATMHGDDERIGIATLTDGVRTLTRAVLDVAGDTVSPRLPPRPPLPPRIPPPPPPPPLEDITPTTSEPG